MKFLVDAQLPPALARWLREAGHEAQAVREVGLREAEDAAIWDYASKTGAVIVTKDDDFLARTQQTKIGPGIVWLSIGNTSNSELRLWFMPQLPQIVSLIEGGARLVELR